MIHASWMEVLWLALATAGWVVSSLNFGEARYDWKRFLHDSDPLRRFITRAIYTGSKIIMFKHTVSLLGAAWAITHSPPPPIMGEPSFWHTQYPGTVICFVIVSLGMMVQAIRSIQWRRQLSTGDYDGKGTASVLRRKDDQPIDQPHVDPHVENT